MSEQNEVPVPIWRPIRNRPNAMDKYREHVNKKFSLSLQDTQDLHKWTVTKVQDFWIDLYGYLGLVPSLPPSMKRAYDDSLPMSSNPKWFEGLETNYAENVLANADRVPDNVALIGIREGQKFGTEETLTWRQVREQVRVVQSALRRSGIQKGDRIAALVGNSIWAVVLFLASASVGAIYSTIAPDLGVEVCCLANSHAFEANKSKGCVSRLQQISAKFLFADSDGTYKGKVYPTASKVTSILEQLGSSKPQETFILPKATNEYVHPSIDTLLRRSHIDDALEFTRVPFTFPLLIAYSSGTTGMPKCIVHHHGLILNLKKVSHLHNNLAPGDVVLQYSSTSWIMFTIMNGHFATGATTICYDGSPLWPDIRSMLRILEYYK